MLLNDIVEFPSVNLDMITEITEQAIEFNDEYLNSLNLISDTLLEIKLCLILIISLLICGFIVSLLYKTFSKFC